MCFGRNTTTEYMSRNTMDMDIVLKLWRIHFLFIGTARIIDWNMKDFSWIVQLNGDFEGNRKHESKLISSIRYTAQRQMSCAQPLLSAPLGHCVNSINQFTFGKVFVYAGNTICFKTQIWNDVASHSGYSYCPIHIAQIDQNQIKQSVHISYIYYIQHTLHNTTIISMPNWLGSVNSALTLSLTI